MLEKIIEKIASYNIFNYILPGIIFSFLLKIFLNINLDSNVIYKDFFTYYFIGLIISRVGSLIIEPCLIKINFIKYAAYPDYIKASKKDNKIETFLEINNMYRTFSSAILILIFVKSYLLLESKSPYFYNHRIALFLILLLILFTFSYKKQTDYIRKRITNASLE